MAADTGPVRVALIGCGLIGSAWDEGRADTDDGPSLSHGRAFSRQPGARIVACCDPQPDRARAAALRWGGGAHADPAELFREHRIDLAVVASASAARTAVIGPALAAGVKALVIEKPLATSLAESRRLVAALQAAGARSLVNYLRHWDPSMDAVGQRLRGGSFGRLQRLVGSYGKGLANNGSHLIDLARLLCAATPVRARSLGSPLPAAEAGWCNGADLAHDAQVDLVNAAGSAIRLDMLATDASAFTCFELRIIGSRAVVDIRSGGRSISVSEVADDPDYPGYRIPGAPHALPARSLEAMDRMAAEAVALAAGRLPRSRCDAGDTLRTAMTVDAVQRSAAEGGRWVDIADTDADAAGGAAAPRPATRSSLHEQTP